MNKETIVHKLLKTILLIFIIYNTCLAVRPSSKNTVDLLTSTISLSKLFSINNICINLNYSDSLEYYDSAIQNEQLAYNYRYQEKKCISITCKSMNNFISMLYFIRAGEYYRYIKKYEISRDCFKKAFNENKTLDVYVFRGKGMTLHCQQMLESAISMYQKSIKLDKNYISKFFTLVYLAKAFDDKDMYSKSFRSSVKALKVIKKAKFTETIEVNNISKNVYLDMKKIANILCEIAQDIFAFKAPKYELLCYEKAMVIYKLLGEDELFELTKTKMNKMKSINQHK